MCTCMSVWDRERDVKNEKKITHAIVLSQKIKLFKF